MLGGIGVLDPRDIVEVYDDDLTDPGRDGRELYVYRVIEPGCQLIDPDVFELISDLRITGDVQDGKIDVAGTRHFESDSLWQQPLSDLKCHANRMDFSRRRQI